MTADATTDHRIGISIALGAIALIAAVLLAATAGTPTAGTAFAVATIAGSLLVLALHVYPTVGDGH
jgi:hypothetical protein